MIRAVEIVVMVFAMTTAYGLWVRRLFREEPTMTRVLTYLAVTIGWGTILVAIVIAMYPPMARASDDCVSICRYGGMSADYCAAMCSAGPAPAPAPIVKSTDYACVSECASKGGAYGLCVDRCSY